MAGRKGGRTSKTDHVLSLLAGGAPAQEAQDTPPQTPASARQEPPARSEQPAGEKNSREEPRISAYEERRMVPPILQVAKVNNEALSETIREALSEELAREEAEQAVEGISGPDGADVPLQQDEPQPDPAPEPESAPPAASAAQSGEEPVPQLEVSQTQTEEEAAPEPPESPTPDSPVPGADGQQTQGQAQVPAFEASPEPFAPRQVRLPDGAVCVNVMELLVDERLERYVHMFGLCTCPRCLADARALALTRLPAKYAVLPEGAATPMLSLYRAKFESQVIAQVIQACKTVMESPRHTV